MNAGQIKIEAGWKEALQGEFGKPYFDGIKDYLKKEKSQGKVVFPPGPLIFNAYNLCPFDSVKVVILGQDPYHNVGEAMGLSFSVPKSMKIPPSLKNIYKEINQDCCIAIPTHGDLTSWAQEGVFLLNAMLTVEQNMPSSHRNIGWQEFTDATIHALSTQRNGLVFLLWGNFAKNKAELIDINKHLVLASSHPSPLAGKSFFGNHHFSKANEYLKSQGKSAINWEIT